MLVAWHTGTPAATGDSSPTQPVAHSAGLHLCRRCATTPLGLHPSIPLLSFGLLGLAEALPGPMSRTGRLVGFPQLRYQVVVHWEAFDALPLLRPGRLQPGAACMDLDIRIPAV